FSIAAPVRDHTGAVIAALGVNGPNARLDDRVQESITSAVLFNAEKLSRMLGWHGDSTISGG
ncbi:IclR family transcriptional regulator C-terminal domain-containing protein, partial [Marivita cryptomonadis]